MDTTMAHTTHEALAAWETGHRRRAIASAVDRVADASLATGGLFLANAALPLGFGIPGGRAGTWIGSSLIATGFAWIARNRRRPVQVPHATEHRYARTAPAFPSTRPALRRAA